MFERAYATGAIDAFKQRVLDNLLRLQGETGMRELALPVGILLVLDRANGGDNIGEELIRRFNLIDVESRNVIDFYFLGWNSTPGGAQPLAFNLEAFQSCRDALRRAGVRGFGGYADLLLFDAWLRGQRVSLDFEQALHIDLAEAVSSKRIANIGGFLEGLIQATQEIRKDADLGASAVVRISDKLGLATARRSMLEFVLDKWGKIIGANALLPLATVRIGPQLDLARLR
jgi:hypothetical protein